MNGRVPLTKDEMGPIALENHNIMVVDGVMQYTNWKKTKLETIDKEKGSNKGFS